MQSTDRPPTPSDHPAASDAAVATALGKIERPTPELAFAMKRGYEVKDVSLRGLFIFLGSLLVSLVIVFIMIYGIMAGLMEREQTREPLGVAVVTPRPEVYAPVQPSPKHPTEDWEDMNMMRRQTQALLASSGVTPTGRRYQPITKAIDQVVDQGLLVLAKNPIEQPMLRSYPPGSTEGHYAAERDESGETPGHK